jgi:hypothetical protein
LRVDHHSIIGQAHVEQGVPCQDSADSGVFIDGRAFAAVADGCSSVRGNTDVGSRQIVAAYRDLVARDPRLVDEAGATFGQRLRERFRALRVTANPFDYYTTLVGVVAQPRRLRFYVSGDGAFAVAYADGTIELTTVLWYRNAPYYLAIRDDARMDALVREIYEPLPDGPVQETTLRYRVHDGAVDVVTRHERWCPLGEFELGKAYDVPRDAIPVVAAAVMTDGVADVGYAPAYEVVAELLDFTGAPAAGFARDRIAAVVRRHGARGEHAMDDLSMAAIVL